MNSEAGDALMRILVVTTFFPNVASPQRAVFVKNLVRAMRQHCEVDVVAPVPYVPPLGLRPAWRAQRAIPSRENIDGIEVAHPRFVVLPKLGWLSGLGYFIGVWKNLSRWKRQLREGEKAVVHAHCAYPDAVGVVLAARLLGLPCVVTAHGSDINVYAEKPGLRFQIRRALRNADGVIAVSARLEERIFRLTDIDRDRLCRIPCAGFDPQDFFPHARSALRKAFGIGENARVVVFVGLLVPIKGVEFLIEAWTGLIRDGRVGEEDRLVLVGDGPMRAALEVQARQSGGNILFTGTLRQTDVARWISAANLLCLPSRNEGTPNVVVEALASGIPVVASRVGGIPELISERENGFLVPPEDSVALARALDAALGMTWDAEKIAASVAHLTWRSIADRNHDFLQSVISRGRQS
jgi:glycosyltransferase involved in cell wall biosynthesis